MLSMIRRAPTHPPCERCDVFVLTAVSAGLTANLDRDNRKDSRRYAVDAMTAPTGARPRISPLHDSHHALLQELDSRGGGSLDRVRGPPGR